MNKIGIIVTTYNRPLIIESFVESIKEFTARHSYQLVVVVDGGDIESYYFAARLGDLAILSSTTREWVAQINLGVSACSSELFCFFNDDTVATRDGWLEDAVNMFNSRFPDGQGLLAFDDGVWGGDHCCFGMTTKTFARSIGGDPLYFPGYVHYGADNEQTDRAKALGKYFNSHIPFRHVRDVDDLSRDGTYGACWRAYKNQDLSLYESRRRNGYR